VNVTDLSVLTAAQGFNIQDDDAVGNTGKKPGCHCRSPANLLNPAPLPVPFHLLNSALGSVASLIDPCDGDAPGWWRL
jgi:hypothetical protein